MNPQGNFFGVCTPSRVRPPLYFIFLFSFWSSLNFVCCFFLLTRGWGRWARGRRRGFSPGAVARHRSRTRGPWILFFPGRWYVNGVFSPLLFLRFWNRKSSCFEIRLHFVVRFQIAGESRLKITKYGFQTLQRCETKSDLQKSKKTGKKTMSEPISDFGSGSRLV